MDRIITLSESQGGYSGFQVTEMIEWSQKSRPKKISRASSKTQKNPWTKNDRKLTPKKSHADFVALKSSQAKEIKSSLKQKGISVTVKPTD